MLFLIAVDGLGDEVAVGTELVLVSKSLVETKVEGKAEARVDAGFGSKNVVAEEEVGIGSSIRLAHAPPREEVTTDDADNEDGVSSVTIVKSNPVVGNGADDEDGVFAT